MPNPLRAVNPSYQAQPAMAPDYHLIEDYLADREWRHSTRQSMRYRLRMLADFLQRENRSLVTADREVLKRWRRDLHTRQDGRDRSPSDQNSHLVGAKGLFEWLIDEELRPDNPTRGLRRPRIPERQPRPGPDQDPKRALMAATESPLYFCWLALILCCGVRCCEIAWALKKDFEPDNQGGARWYCQGKGGKERIIPVSPGVFREVQPYLESGRRDGHLFTRIDGGPLDPERVSRRLREFLRRHGVQTTPHQFRHRFSTSYGEFDGNVYRHARVMGHSKLEDTLKYTATQPTMAPMARVADRHLSDVPRPTLTLVPRSSGRSA